MPGSGPAPSLIRICLDLNVWVADFLGTRRGRRGGSGPWLADAVRSATSPAGPLQLVVSLGMLERLALVLARDFGVEASTATMLTRAIEGIAALGPAGDHPYVLFGSGVYPVRDEEDRHVLEVALAGDADVLATANLGDFNIEGIGNVGDGERIKICSPPGRRPLIIAHPDDVCNWLRSGVLPTVEAVRGLTPST